MSEQDSVHGTMPLLNTAESFDYEPVRDAAALRHFMGSMQARPALPTQLALAGMESLPSVHVPSRLAGEPDPLDFSLFFAGFAEWADNQRLCEQGAMLASEHGLRNAVQVPERAHVTLCSLNRHEVLNLAVIDAAKAAAGRFPCPALPMVFDRACSYAADGAFMLKGDPATERAVAQLRKPLMAMLRRFGLKPDEAGVPHMTMVYNCGKVVAEQPITPWMWTMRRFALVLSHVGNKRHECLQEWTLPRA